MTEQKLLRVWASHPVLGTPWDWTKTPQELWAKPDAGGHGVYFSGANLGCSRTFFAPLPEALSSFLAEHAMTLVRFEEVAPEPEPDETIEYETMDGTMEVHLALKGAGML